MKWQESQFMPERPSPLHPTDENFLNGLTFDSNNGKSATETMEETG
jgi:hypothetical protein